MENTKEPQQEEKGAEFIKEESLQDYANKMARELLRVKSIAQEIPMEELNGSIEKVKVSQCMYSQLFEVLVNEHVRRHNEHIVNRVE